MLDKFQRLFFILLITLISLLGACCSSPQVENPNEIISFKLQHKKTLIKDLSTNQLPFDMVFLWKRKENVNFIDTIVFDFRDEKVVKFKLPESLRSSCRLEIYNADKLYTFSSKQCPNVAIIVNPKNKTIDLGQ